MCEIASARWSYYLHFIVQKYSLVVAIISILFVFSPVIYADVYEQTANDVGFSPYILPEDFQHSLFSTPNGNPIQMRERGRFKYTQQLCVSKHDKQPSWLAVDGAQSSFYCVTTIVLAPQLHKLVFEEGEPRGRQIHQYVVEVGRYGVLDGPKPMELLIEEPPQVSFRMLPEICRREQHAIVCRINQRIKNADGIYRIRLPLIFVQEVTEGSLSSKYIPTRLLIDNCRGDGCRPDDRSPLMSGLSAGHIARTDSYQWVYWGALSGALISFCLLLLHRLFILSPSCRSLGARLQLLLQKIKLY